MYSVQVSSRQSSTNPNWFGLFCRLLLLNIPTAVSPWFMVDWALNTDSLPAYCWLCICVLPVHTSVCLSVSLCVSLSLFLIFFLHTAGSVSVSCQSIRLSVCLSVSLCVSLSLFLSLPPPPLSQSLPLSISLSLCPCTVQFSSESICSRGSLFCSSVCCHVSKTTLVVFYWDCCDVSESVWCYNGCSFTGTVVVSVVVFQSLYALPSSSVSLGLLCCFRVCTVFHHCLFHWDCCAVSESVQFSIIVCFTGTLVLFQSLYGFPSLSVSLGLLCCFRVCTVFHHCLFHWDCCAVSESVRFSIIVCFTGTVVLFPSLYSFPSLSVSLVVLRCFRVSMGT